MEITKKDIEQLIELKREDTFFNHLKTIYSFDFRPTGEIGRNEIKLWRQNSWNRTFYPIFRFELNANNHLINITDKLNPIGKTFILIFLLGFLYLIFPENPFEFDVIDNWPITTFIIVMVITVVFISRMVYRFEKKNQLEQIFKLLDIEVEEKKIENEWSWKNILIRLFTYPFCIFLIGVNIFSIIPNGQYFLALGTFLVVGYYLIADIKMIVRKKTTGNNV
ncbi:hypothetical protein [Aequorivita lipolytica]|uniref:Uncharacterized protein n=1 Tax=Aequorivita lipolytica TaxID=153267 RepID=A0A5C6YKH5_9FLAO|nr:hypothetical protein [Aequorivita lipolytica]TXD67841.1 hypothetical protein ESV24_14815 [Aequorivita lipolytica]SRX54014.1 hypothetical protein AEQU2_03039 [Aequorivita lipolytica]